MERARIRIQSDWDDYDRKKVKKKRFVFLKKSKDLTEKDHWYLERYFSISKELENAYRLKEPFIDGLNKRKTMETKVFQQTKEKLELFYKEVESPNIPEFQRTINTFKTGKRKF